MQYGRGTPHFKEIECLLSHESSEPGKDLACDITKMFTSVDMQYFVREDNNCVDFRKKFDFFPIVDVLKFLLLLPLIG